jgi:hypothetical protein
MKLRNIGYAAFVVATAAAFVLGAAGSSEAKGKKKMAAEPAPPSCLLSADAPVCGARGGMKFTYKNSCYAAKDGAKSVSPGPCKAAKAKKGKKGGMKKAAKKPMKKK